MKTVAWLSLAAAVCLGGCNFAPGYKAPKVELPARFEVSEGATGAGAALSLAWWRDFHDPLLDRLEADVDAANPDLAAAMAAYRAATARAQAAESGLFPEIDFGGGLSANKQSANRPLRSKSQPDFYGANESFVDVASYELDVWGRVANLVRAADATAEALADALADARLGLHAELARDYVALRGLDAEAKLLNDTIGLYKSALDLTRQRLGAKIAPPIDEQRAETQLATAQAQASDLALRRAQLVDAIATLAGKPAAGFHLPPSPRLMTLPVRPHVVPGDVLRRRPDVAEAERLVATANALIGSARAARYPRFTLGLLAGTQDTALNLLSLPNAMYTIGPSISVPLFDFGRREAEVKQAEASFDAAAERYRSVVLRAVREVQDDLYALRWLAQESKQTDAAATAARKALEMSMALYRDGAASYLDVVTAQDAALLTQRTAIGIHSREMAANVGLALALGGGWSRSPARTASLALVTPVIGEP